MLAVERRNRIEQIINKNKSVLVVELAKQFEVTTCLLYTSDAADD